MTTIGYPKMYDAVQSLPTQAARCTVDLPESVKNELSTADSVVACAMGGSAFPMEIVKTAFAVPVEIHRDYGDTLELSRAGALYLLMSFSGNTEEVLDCAARLQQSGARMVVITNGGKLAAFAAEHGIARLGFPSLPADFQPRCATGYFLGLVLGLFDAIGLTQGAGSALSTASAQLVDVSESVQEEAAELAAAVQDGELFMLGYKPYVMSVGQIGKIKFNENAKRLVHLGAIPEFNHNEMEAALGSSESAVVVILASVSSSERKLHRLSVTGANFARRGAHVHTLQLPGFSMLADTLYGVWLLDFASLFVAKAQGTDPMSIDAIEGFKLELNA